MFESFRAFSVGWRFHVRGIRFGLSHPSFLILAALPFLVTLTLYIFAFYMFIHHAEDLLQMVWHPETGESSWVVGWLHWTYTHIVKWILYLIVLMIMFYTFIVLSVVIASPVYDYISTKYERVYYQNASEGEAAPSGRGLLTILKEEVKKALFMLMIPIPLLFVPVVGTLLSFVVAGVFIAWDFTDFSLSRDRPLLRDRMRAVWRYKWSLLGFGSPLLIPFLGLVLVPFAILGSTKLYFETMKSDFRLADPKQNPMSAE
ncbi:MAG: EI24 domain-containing protein [Deltaproteobacteria bacterium]|nr:EI24 domain-containing protein [Deltaproteobacteria bacterium]MBW1859777.1 EI24 domain-containing protein [Deltaproteobacteria bacterium]